MKTLKQFQTTFLFLFAYTIVSAQLKVYENAAIKVNYKVTHAFDTTDLNKKAITNMTLYIGQEYSVYRNAGYEVWDRARTKNLQSITEHLQSGDASKPITRSKAKKVPLTELIKRTDNRLLYRKEKLVSKDYVMEDHLPQIQWMIDPETKMVGNMKAQKANGSFRGRVYTAWFAPQIPIQTGPWKLGGLPGIILEASDERKEIEFAFLNFEYLSDRDSILIALPEKYIRTKEPDFDKLYNLYLQDPVAFITNKYAEQGLTISINGGSFEDINKNRANKKAYSPINNPIELIKE